MLRAHCAAEGRAHLLQGRDRRSLHVTIFLTPKGLVREYLKVTVECQEYLKVPGTLYLWSLNYYFKVLLVGTCCKLQ